MSRKVFRSDLIAIRAIISEHYKQDESKLPYINQRLVRGERFKGMFRVKLAADAKPFFVDTLKKKIYDSQQEMIGRRHQTGEYKPNTVTRETKDDAIIGILDCNANDAKKAINKVTSIPDLERLLTIEKKNKARKVVIECAEKQIQQIEDGEV